ncbi:hypothetical protein [Clostridium polyendosporum]|nr:hypothetical protein [Clostridium polyendosporum]
MYIILSISKNDYKKHDFYFLCGLNLILVIIQSRLGWRDDVSGVFGISNVQGFFLFLLIIYCIGLTRYLYNKINLMLFSIISLVIFIISGIGEIKVAFIIIPVISIIGIVLNQRNYIKLFKIGIPIVFMIIIGFNILVQISPNFKSFFSYDYIGQNIYNYTMRTNDERFYLGRIENIAYTNNYILTSQKDKITGLGIGYAMPDENWYYTADFVPRGRSIINLYETKLYQEYGLYFGYHFSSMNIIYLEGGIIGLITFYLIISIQFLRSFKILKKTNKINYKCLSNASISLLIALVLLMFYYPYLIDINANLLFIIVMALITNVYKLE